MKMTLFLVRDTDAARKENNYPDNNKFRMTYDEYREQGLPIGSGLINGQCKQVVNNEMEN